MPRALFRPKTEAGRKGLGLPVNPNLSPVTRDYPRALPRTSSPRREPPRGALCSLKEPCEEYLRIFVFAQGGRSKNILTVNNL